MPIKYPLHTCSNTNIDSTDSVRLPELAKSSLSIPLHPLPGGHPPKESTLSVRSASSKGPPPPPPGGNSLRNITRRSTHHPLRDGASFGKPILMRSYGSLSRSTLPLEGTLPPKGPPPPPVTLGVFRQYQGLIKQA